MLPRNQICIQQETPQIIQPSTSSVPSTTDKSTPTPHPKLTPYEIKTLSPYTEQSLNWWQSPVNGKTKYPKHQMNPNELYYQISPDEKERYYIKKKERKSDAYLKQI